MDRAHLKQANGPAAANPGDATLRPANGSFVGRTEGLAADAFVDLEKIRDILFGAERRESERKLAEFEKRLEAQAVQADLELQRHMEAFEEQIKAEVHSIANEISANQRKSADNLETLARELRASMNEIEQQVRSLTAKTSAAEQELRQELGQQVSNLTSSLRNSVDELDANVERKVQDLRVNSVDWSGLAVTLRDLASQVATKRPGRDESAIRTD